MVLGLDAANEIPHPFWVDWRADLVKSINPDADICGEIYRLGSAVA